MTSENALNKILENLLKKDKCLISFIPTHKRPQSTTEPDN